MRLLRALPLPGKEPHPFVVLPENRLAYTAATRLVSQTAPEGGLVVIEGPAGCGKSHLLRQSTRALLADSQTQAVCLTTGETLLQDLRRLHSQGQFPAVFQEGPTGGGNQRSERWSSGLKVLICDDLDPLAESNEGQRLLCVLIDQLLKRQGRLLFTRLPAAGSHQKWIRRLTNRLQGGIQTQITPYSPQSRLRLLQHFCSVYHVPVEPPVLQRLARELDVSGGDLLQAVFDLKTHRGTVQAVEKLISQVQARRPLTLPQIVEVVSRLFEVDPEELRSARRSQYLVIPRQLAMLLARDWTDLKLTEIGQYFQDRNHSTVVHACRKIEARLQSDERLRQQQLLVMEQLRPGATPGTNGSRRPSRSRKE